MTLDKLYYDENCTAACGVTLVELNEPHLDYEYNTLLFVAHAQSGRVFLAADSGCSCPVPFEGDRWVSPDDNTLEEVTASNLPDVLRRMNDFPAPQDDRHRVGQWLTNLLKGVQT